MFSLCHVGWVPRFLDTGCPVPRTAGYQKVIGTTVCTVYSVQCTVYSVQCTVYSVQCTVYSVQCTVYSVQCTVYSVQCTVYSVQCTVYSVQCTVYTAYKKTLVKENDLSLEKKLLTHQVIVRCYGYGPCTAPPTSFL